MLRIVNRVNRKCGIAFGRPLIEKRGKKWAFTDFDVKIWGKNERISKLMLRVLAVIW